LNVAILLPEIAYLVAKIQIFAAVHYMINMECVLCLCVGANCWVDDKKHSLFNQ